MGRGGRNTLIDYALVAMNPLMFVSLVQDGASIDCSISIGALLFEGWVDFRCDNKELQVRSVTSI